MVPHVVLTIPFFRVIHVLVIRRARLFCLSVACEAMLKQFLGHAMASHNFEFQPASHSRKKHIISFIDAPRLTPTHSLICLRFLLYRYSFKFPSLYFIMCYMFTSLFLQSLSKLGSYRNQLVDTLPCMN